MLCFVIRLINVVRIIFHRRLVQRSYRKKHIFYESEFRKKYCVTHLGSVHVNFDVCIRRKFISCNF